MAYIADANDITNPLDTVDRSTAAEEFRTLKTALNTISTVASATSPDIFATAAMTVNYTGTVIATSFAAAANAGQHERTLVCAAAARFTASANLLIDGVASGATLTVAAGTVFKVLALSTTQFRMIQLYPEPASASINISATTSTDTTTKPVLVGASATGEQLPFVDAELSYNASTGVLTATGFAGDLAGNADTATAADSATTAAAVTGSAAVTGAVTTASASAAYGFASGAGGTVTQATSKSTGVTLNKRCGKVEMNAAALAAGASVSFLLTNSVVGLYDIVNVAVSGLGGQATANAYSVRAMPFNGSVYITLKNETADSLSEQVPVIFNVMDGVIA